MKSTQSSFRPRDFVHHTTQVTLISLLLAGLAACGGGGGAGAGASPGGGGGPPQGPPPVSVAAVVGRTVQEFDEFTARLEATETVDVRARVAGTLERVNFKDGQMVKRGELLFALDARPFQAELARAEANLASANVQANLAKSEIARAEKLLPMQAVSAQEVDQLRANLRNAEAQMQAAQATIRTARINTDFTRITAPINGRISRANVTVGNLVGVSEPVLTTIVSTNKVYAYFDASEDVYLKYVKAAKDGTRPSSRETANPVVMGLNNEQGYPHKGVIDFIDNRLNPISGTVRARAVFDNADGQFTPGLFARVKLIGSGSYQAALVPDRAISTDQTRKVVMVIGANNIVEPREVKPGALFEGMRAVAGVKPGENIIVDGLQRAQPGAPVTPNVVKLDEKGQIVQQAQPPAQQPAQAAPADTKADAKSAPAAAQSSNGKSNDKK